MREPSPSHLRGALARRGVALATLAATLVPAACTADEATGAGGRTDDSVVSTDPAVLADARLPDPAEYATNDGNVVEEPGFVQVDANTATSAELAAAFDANDIADGATLAASVIAHRPYDAADTTGGAFDELRAALADAGLDEFTVEAVVASLTV